MDQPALYSHGLVKVYDTVKALDGVTFHVGRGEVFGLLGPNGAGKSTCMKIFTGLVKPTGGQAFVMGFDVVRNSIDAKRQMGFLPEFPALFENLTGREFVTMMGMMRGMTKNDVDCRVESFAKALALDEQMDHLLGTYSKGMRQKISFTAAVIHQPPVLILDEPTSGLDPRFGKYIKDIIRLMKKEGHTVLMSTHITNVAEELCDRIAIIDHGRIASMGTVNEVVGRVPSAKNLEEAFVTIVEGGA
ncbi:MAG: ABC transporter ATP-binding protein [Candidatus Thermoplasmatota archaeon]|nr:ABC transporter ATP-binding protein [Candidatus Thermoplasmatota archaeon]